MTSPAADATACDLTIAIGGLQLAMPVMGAAGCAGFGQELARLGLLESFGAIVTPSLRARSGATAHRARLVESPSGIVLPTDWPSIGADSLQPANLPWEGTGIPVIASLLGNTSGDLAAAAHGLRHRTHMRGVRAVEVNLAVPNAANNGVPFAHDAFAATKAVAGVRGELPREVPVLAKLAADVTDVVEIARGCVKSGAEGIVVTAPLRAVSLRGLSPDLPPTATGLSGPALLPVTLRAVWDLRAAILTGRLGSVAIIAVGGIDSPEAAAHAISAGATAVQLGSALVHDPGSGATVSRGLGEQCRLHGASSIRDLVGAAHHA